MELDHARKLFDYHHWAADKLFEALADVSAADLDKPWGGSFKTARALLRHIVGAEMLWLERFGGTSPKALPEFPPTHTGADYLSEWRKVKQREKEFVAALDRRKLAGDLTYVNMKGEQHSFLMSDVLTHVVNHGTYHRGQLSHLLRDLGRPGVSTDYVAWLAVKNSR
jgi:uncharacterized damage-inducible protein DinB